MQNYRILSGVVISELSDINEPVEIDPRVMELAEELVEGDELEDFLNEDNFIACFRAIPSAIRERIVQLRIGVNSRMVFSLQEEVRRRINAFAA